MIDAVDAARDRIGHVIFKTCEAHDIDDLVRLMREFTDTRATRSPKAGRTVLPTLSSGSSVVVLQARIAGAGNWC